MANDTLRLYEPSTLFETQALQKFNTMIWKYKRDEFSHSISCEVLYLSLIFKGETRHTNLRMTG